MSFRVDTFLTDLPTRRQEAWKYTDLKRVAAIADGLGWRRAEAALATPVEGPVCELDADRCVIVNGALVEGSRLVATEDGFLLVGNGDRPVHLVFVASAADGTAVASDPHITIGVENGRHLDLIESHVTQGVGNTLSLPTVMITVRRDARLRHAVITDENEHAFHVARTHITLEQGAAYEGFALETGRGLARRETEVSIDGAHADLFLGGAYLGRGASHQDNTTLVTHDAPNARSRQNFRGVLSDESRGVFQGKVLVSMGAQGTDGQQQHKALLLSPKAEVDAKPELEIYADDVECAHGATVGAIDEDQLFYMRARGIPEDAARALLTEAFLMQSLSGITDEGVREAFRTHLAARLEGVS